MNNFVDSIIASALAGMGGTGLGAAIAIIFMGMFKKNKSMGRLDNIIKLAMSFSGGLMLSIICFDLMPESFEFASINAGVFSMIAGCITIPAFELVAKLMKLPFTIEDTIGSRRGSSKYMKTGILVAFGIALHNFPEGLAVGSGFVGDLGIILAIVIALHDIPEGVAMAVPLIAVGKRPVSVLMISILAGLPMVLGDVFGWYFAGISEKFIGICLGYAGGAMMYVVMGQLLPICYKDDGPKGIVTTMIAGLIGGILMINVL